MNGKVFQSRYRNLKGLPPPADKEDEEIGSLRARKVKMENVVEFLLFAMALLLAYLMMSTC